MWEQIKQYKRGILAGHTLWTTVNDDGKRVYCITLDHITNSAYRPIANPNQCTTNKRNELSYARMMLE